ncbi:MAG TPA: TadE family protein [Anaeromyxobacteraceae bacterium]|jgi:Flp pilus assembly protein TadG|nr:TadE family protein [Anaeromyxobacteraceae bacterium]
MSSTRRERRRERGAAAVEFAILLPVLLLLVLGAMDWGYYFFVEQVIVNAAREGARAGSLQLWATNASGAQSDAVATCRNFITQASLSLAATAAPCTATVTAGNVTVQASYSSGSLTGFAKTFVPTQATATAQMAR